MGLLTFRRAGPTDAGAMGALHVTSWRETYAGLLPDEMLASLSVDARGELWRKVLGDRSTSAETEVHVAEDDGRLIGFGSCGRLHDHGLTKAGFTGEISAIYILRSHQGMGVGRQIMRDMAETLRHRDRTAATLWVLREHAAARGFYEHLGGTIVGEKTEERAATVMAEVAYGWLDITLLLR